MLLPVVIGRSVPRVPVWLWCLCEFQLFVLEIRPGALDGSKVGVGIALDGGFAVVGLNLVLRHRYL
ncbi:uncharacterized protein BDV14DRAFT_170044 [Aspergillus stella-maris]|uniref:uncharacterized protein n=1 Tax=Aspergillus stella-maris TaxID=1810926 RepID=UPI003CCDA2A1